MTFNEANTVEASSATGSAAASRTTPPSALVSRRRTARSRPRLALPRPAEPPAPAARGAGRGQLREALIRLNPEIAAEPDRADEVLYRLRAILLVVRSDGLVRANEEFTAWLHGERSMPFGPNGEHVTDPADRLRRRRAATSTSSPPSSRSRRARPRSGPTWCCWSTACRWSSIEAKTPVRASRELVRRRDPDPRRLRAQRPRAVRAERASRSPPRARSSATARSACRSSCGGRGAIEADATTPALQQVETGGQRRCCGRSVVLDLLANFTAYRHRQEAPQIKIIARYQQYEAANQIVERVVAGHPKKGLIWHFQGSGKSLLMVFAAQKLRLHPALRQPDRADRGRPHRPRHPDHRHVQRRRHAEPGRGRDAARSCRRCSAQDVRKIIITTIHKFGEADGVLNDRDNIIVDGRRGAPHAGRRPRPQDARGAAERVPVRPDRHADQPRRPQHLLGLRRRRGRAAAT